MIEKWMIYLVLINGVNGEPRIYKAADKPFDRLSDCTEAIVSGDYWMGRFTDTEPEAAYKLDKWGAVRRNYDCMPWFEQTDEQSLRGAQPRLGGREPS